MKRFPLPNCGEIECQTKSNNELSTVKKCTYDSFISLWYKIILFRQKSQRSLHLADNRHFSYFHLKIVTSSMRKDFLRLSS